LEKNIKEENIEFREESGNKLFSGLSMLIIIILTAAVLFLGFRLYVMSAELTETTSNSQILSKIVDDSGKEYVLAVDSETGYTYYSIKKSADVMINSNTELIVLD